MVGTKVGRVPSMGETVAGLGVLLKSVGGRVIMTVGTPMAVEVGDELGAELPEGDALGAALPEGGLVRVSFPEDPSTCVEFTVGAVLPEGGLVRVAF